MHWNHYAINLIVKFTISIWADQCITSKEKFMDREYELLLLTCLSLLEEIKQDPTQILSSDRESLIVKVKHMKTWAWYRSRPFSKRTRPNCH